ncbi:MAG: ImmA/IrrE family metallo-endopeptidase, partial [Pseudomonadota bacterium]
MSDLDARRKLFLGPQIRKLRRGLKLTQAQMAEGLDISASYLTLIERNQRPLTAQLMLRLAEAYDIDIRALAPNTDGSIRVGLKDVAADPLLASTDVTARELQEMADLFPRAAEALVRLHEGYRQAQDDAEALAETASEGIPSGGLGSGPVEEARDALHANDNYYSALEDAAVDIANHGALRLDLPQALTASLVNHLKSKHNVDVIIMPFDVMKGLLRRFDRHRNRLLLSELLPPSGRTFQVASLVGQLEAGELVRSMSAHRSLTSDSARGIYRLNLANYLAGAIMFPYERFLEAAERLRYDVDVLASRFGASFEQTAHRITTLRRPGARGVPFFMIRVDRAGNISKRFGGGVFPFAR